MGVERYCRVDETKPILIAKMEKKSAHGELTLEHWAFTRRKLAVTAATEYSVTVDSSQIRRTASISGTINAVRLSYSCLDSKSLAVKRVGKRLRV